jgi:hypothetical protein
MSGGVGKGATASVMLAAMAGPSNEFGGRFCLASAFAFAVG